LKVYTIVGVFAFGKKNYWLVKGKKALFLILQYCYRVKRVEDLVEL